MHRVLVLFVFLALPIAFECRAEGGPSRHEDGTPRLYGGAPAREERPALSHKEAGDRLFMEGKISSAIGEYTRSLAAAPLPDAYFNLAIAHYAQGDLDGALLALERLIELDPHDAEAHYNLGCLRLCRNDVEGARHAFNRAKDCCAMEPRLQPLIEKGLRFVETLENEQPGVRQAVLTFLQIGLPARPLPEPSSA